MTSDTDHSVTALKDLGVRVALNTGNRWASGTTMTREMGLLALLALLADEAGGPPTTSAPSR